MRTTSAIVAALLCLVSSASAQVSGINTPIVQVKEGSERCVVPLVEFDSTDFDGVCNGHTFDVSLGTDVSVLGACIGDTAAEFCTTELHTGAVDMGSATLEIPNATTLPASCTIGELFADSDADVPDDLSYCSAANTWTSAGGDLVSAGVSGGQTWNGGTATSDNARINANDQAFDFTNTGRVNFGERFNLLHGVTAETISTSVGAIINMSGQTFTMDNTGSILNFLAVSPTLNYTVAPLGGSTPVMFSFTPTVKNSVSGGASFAATTVYKAGVTYDANEEDTLFLSLPLASFLDVPDFTVTGAGTYNASGFFRSFYADPTVASGVTFSGTYIGFGAGREGTGTITGYTAFHMPNLSNVTNLKFIDNNDPDGTIESAGKAIINATGSPATDAALEIGGTDGALLIPRHTTAQRTALASTDGFVVQDTDLDVPMAVTDGQWARLSPMPRCVTVESPTSSEDIFIFKSLGGATRIHEVSCIVEDATSVTITIDECNGDGNSCAASTSSTACAVTSTAVTVTDAVVDNDDILRLKSSATSGSPGMLMVCLVLF